MVQAETNLLVFCWSMFGIMGLAYCLGQGSVVVCGSLLCSGSMAVPFGLSGVAY